MRICAQFDSFYFESEKVMHGCKTSNVFYYPEMLLARRLLPEFARVANQDALWLLHPAFAAALSV
eukprot:scaffold293670_cov17-Tisochrysis_lutea.AAC.1